MGPWSRRRSRRNTVSRLVRHRDNSVLADRKAVSESGGDDDGDLPGLGKGRGKGKGGPHRSLPSTSSSDASSPSTEPFTQPPASETTTSSDTTTTDFTTTSALFEPPESTSLPLVSTQLSQPLPPIETQSAIAPTPTSSVPELSPVLSTLPSGTTTTAPFPTIPASQGSIGRNDLDAQQIAGIVVGSSGLLLLLAITSLLIVLRRRRRGSGPNPRKRGIADLFRGLVSRSTVRNRTSGHSSPETEEKRPLAPEPRRLPSTGSTLPFHLSSPSSSSSSSSSASLSHSDVDVDADADADAFSVLSLPTTFAADRPTSPRISAGTYTGTFLSPTPLRHPTYPAPAATRPDPNGKNPGPGHGPPQLGAPPIPLTARLSSVGVG